MIYAGSSGDDLLLAINCLDKLLLRHTRKVPIQRILGFVKRLSTICLQLQPGQALAVLAVLKKCVQVISCHEYSKFVAIVFQLMHRYYIMIIHVTCQSYSQCEQLLDVDAMVGSGLYRPDVPDPEMSFSSSTSLWELADLCVRERGIH